MNENEDYSNRPIRPRDKLDYRQVLLRKAEACLDALGTTAIDRRVKSLFKATFFNIPGLPFKSELKKEEYRLKFKYLVQMKMIQQERDTWNHPIKRDIATIDYYTQYWEDMLEFLLDLLAKHEGLVLPRDIVEIGQEPDI